MVVLELLVQREPLELSAIREVKDFQEHLVDWEPRDCLVSRVCQVVSEPLEALVTRVRKDFQVCLVPQVGLVRQEQLVSGV